MKNKNLKLLPYVAIDNENCHNRHILQERAKDVSFPLSQEDKDIIEQLKFQFANEENCAGLAAPQIGFHKQIIVFSVPEDMKEYRDDVYDILPTTLLINPDYEALSPTKVRDWEGCFSVDKVMGEVDRYERIRYWGFNEQGQRIEGEARGFAARLIQHEIGHLKGELIINVFAKDGRNGTFEEMRKIRQEEFEGKATA